MRVTVFPGRLRGEVTAPPSKSHAQRLLLAAALSGTPCRIRCADPSRDISVMAEALRALGAEIAVDADGYTVRGGINVQGAPVRVDCAESGAALRFLVPLCCRMEREITLFGSAGLGVRPMTPLLDALKQNGARIEGNALPLRVSGGLRGGVFGLPGHISSQFFSGLFFALPLLPEGSLIRAATPLASAPYLEMTLRVLRDFDVRIEAVPDGFRVAGGQQYRAPALMAVEGDWSGAAFWLAANKLGSAIRVTGLNGDSPQGDRRIRTLLTRLGGEIDLKDHPDLLPILAVCAMAHPGRTVFRAVSRLRFKESDRVESVCRLAHALGGYAEAAGDDLTVYGGEIFGGTVDGCGDHRIVMSAAIAALCAKEPVTILGAEAAQKSYPRFWEDMRRLGGKIQYA